MRRLPLLLAALTLVGAACVQAPAGEVTPTATGPAATAAAPSPSHTASQAPPTSTPRPVEGTTRAQVNVRSGPGTGYDSLGLLDSGEKVQIVASDSQGQWYQILYPPAPQGRGWIAAQFVQVPAGTEIPPDATPTPAGPTGRLTQRLNVRSGPATTFDSLGLLEPNTIVSLTGKNSTASWFQIEFQAGPSGHGWVTAQYVQTDAAGGLPVLDDYGSIVTPGAAATSPGPETTPTPTIGPAYADGDSPGSPSIQVTFSANGTRQFVYSSQVSWPEGDTEDWVEFTPFAAGGGNARLTFSLACSGSTLLTAELWQGGTLLSSESSIQCGDQARLILLVAGLPYQLRLAAQAQAGPQLVQYQLTVRNEP